MRNDNEEVKIIDVFPFIEGQNTEEALFITLIETTINTNQNGYREQVKNKFKELDKPEDYIRLGLAFMKSCFFKYINP